MGCNTRDGVEQSLQSSVNVAVHLFHITTLLHGQCVDTEKSFGQGGESLLYMAHLHTQREEPVTYRIGARNEMKHPLAYVYSAMYIHVPIKFVYTRTMSCKVIEKRNKDMVTYH